MTGRSNRAPAGRVKVSFNLKAMKQQNENAAARITLTCRQMNTTSESIVVIDDPSKAMVPALVGLVRNGGGPLPTLADHTCKVHMLEGYATYDVYRGRALVGSGVVAWNPSTEKAAWQHAQAEADELGVFPLVLADEDMDSIEPRSPQTPPDLPWAATALRRAALHWEGADPAKVFCLAVNTSEGLMITAPLTAATTHSCAAVARIESLLACAIVACANEAHSSAGEEGLSRALSRV